MATLADIYLRLSDFRKDEADSFPDREKQLRELAGRLGWAVRRVAIENDVDEVGQRKPASAFKRREIKHPDGTVEKIVWRPEFRNLIADLYAGRIQAVLAEIWTGSPASRATWRISWTPAKTHGRASGRCLGA